MKNIIISILCIILMLPFALAAETNSESSIVKVTFISQTPDPVEPGNYVDLRWRVQNLGGIAEDYIFEIRPEYPFALDAGKSNKITDTTVGSYETSEQGAVIYFKVRVAADAVENAENLVKLYYYRKDGLGGEQFIETPIRIQSTQGLVNIAGIKIEPAVIQPGTPFDISIDVDNLGSQFINNVRVTLATDGTGFTPLGQTNQIVLNRILGGQTGTFRFNYFVDANNAIKTYSIPLTINYTDSLGRENSVTTQTGIPVQGVPRYLANLDKQAQLANEKADIVVSISNVGKSDMNFVTLELQSTSDYSVLSSNVGYLGNLKSDDLQTQQYSIFITNKEKTDIPIKFKVQYRDGFDKSYVQEFELANKVFTEAQAKQFGISASNGSSGIIIIIVVILLIVGAIWFFRRNKKKSVK